MPLNFPYFYVAMSRHLDNQLFREARRAASSLSAVEKLIAAGADVNRKGKYGNTPLWEAAFHGHTEIAVALLDAGADHSIYSDDGSGPLYWAAAGGHEAIVEILIDRGADPNALGCGGTSPLNRAIGVGNRRSVEMLVNAGANMDHRYFDQTTPEYAEWKRQPELAEYLRRSRRRKQQSIEH